MPDRPAVARLGIAVVFVALVGCGSPSSAISPKPAAQEALVQSCNAVAAVLSDGPDPDADSVGYALAQIQPLESLTIHDTPLRQAVAQLAQAYQTFYDAKGAGGDVKNQVTAGVNAVNKICPGVAG